MPLLLLLMAGAPRAEPGSAGAHASAIQVELPAQASLTENRCSAGLCTVKGSVPEMRAMAQLIARIEALPALAWLDLVRVERLHRDDHRIHFELDAQFSGADDRMGMIVPVKPAAGLRIDTNTCGGGTCVLEGAARGRAQVLDLLQSIQNWPACQSLSLQSDERVRGDATQWFKIRVRYR